MGRRWNCVSERKDICSKQQKDQGENSMGKSWSSRYRAFRTTKDARTTQMELLVARSKRRCQEICTRLLQVSIEQSPISEEIGRTTSIGNTSRTMARD